MKDIEYRLGTLLGVGLDQNLFARPGNAGIGVLEVVALLHFFGCLVQGVVSLLLVNLAYYVE